VVALQTGDPVDALRQLDRLAEVQPFSAEEAVVRAMALQASGSPVRAEEILQRAIAEEPYYFQAYSLLAQLWVATGRAATARAYFLELVERMPDSRLLRSVLAQLLAQAGDWPAAEAQWRAVLNLVPDDETALAPLLQRLAGSGREAEALALMHEAHTYNPRSFANNQRLVEQYDRLGDTEKTVAAMIDLAESGPVNALLFRDLAANLKKLGREAERRDALLRGRRVATTEGEAALLAEFNRLLRDQ
jgi:predicted Zn-dependent protease